MQIKKLCISLIVFSKGISAYAFQDTKVLPQGVRTILYMNVDTSIDTKTDNSGSEEPLSEPLEKDLTFKKIMSGKTQVENQLLKGAMLSAGYEENDALGRYQANIKANVNVNVALMAYGLTEQLTLAVALPYYQAATNVAVGFQSYNAGQKFIDSLTSSQRFNFAPAYDAYNKLSNAPGELNQKLIDNGYSPLQEWQDDGMGDVTIAGKYLVHQGEHMALATTGGVVLPTGKLDDPDILTDISFGDGTYDLYGQLTADYTIFEGMIFNTFYKYSYQVASEKEIRLVSYEEPIIGDKKNVQFKLGDKFESGISWQYEPQNGIISGLEYEYKGKFGDRYEVEDELVKEKYQDKTSQKSLRQNLVLGYSTVPAFRRKEFAVPFKLAVNYSKYLQSKASTTNDIVTVNMQVYF